jgi:hypothetical protein
LLDSPRAHELRILSQLRRELQTERMRLMSFPFNLLPPAHKTPRAEAA